MGGGVGTVAMPAHAPRPGPDDPLDLHGVIPPTVTAFDDDETLDPEGTAEHARFVVDRGVHGVFPLGTNGEFALLSADERDRVVEAVVDEVGGEAPVIAGVGEPSTRETVERARAAADAGADGVVVVTPYYFPIDREGAIEHYRRVTDAVSVPVYVYHIPGRTGNAFDRETLDGIAALDGIAGVKDSSKDVPWLGRAIDDHPELTFLSGSDSLLFPGLSLGCSGMISAVANAFPELVVECYEAFDEGDVERSRTLQSRIYHVREAIKRGPYMAGVKASLALRGFDAGPLRSPLRALDEEERNLVERDLVALDLL